MRWTHTQASANKGGNSNAKRHESIYRLVRSKASALSVEFSHSTLIVPRIAAKNRFLSAKNSICCVALAQHFRYVCRMWKFFGWLRWQMRSWWKISGKGLRTMEIQWLSRGFVLQQWRWFQTHKLRWMNFNFKRRWMSCKIIKLASNSNNLRTR